MSIENFGFNAVVFIKYVLLNCKMSQMYVSHSRVEDIASEYSKEKRLSDIWTFILLASLKFLILSLGVDFQDKGIYNQKVNTEL